MLICSLRLFSKLEGDAEPQMKTLRANTGQSTSAQQMELLGLFEEDSLPGEGFLRRLLSSPSLILRGERAVSTLAPPQDGQPSTSPWTLRLRCWRSICFSHSVVQRQREVDLQGGLSHSLGGTDPISCILVTMNGLTRVRGGS